MHYVQTLKKNVDTVILETTVRSLWSIISTNHMTPLCDHPVIHSALTNKHAAWRQRWVVGNADLLDINSEALAQPAQFSSVEESRK